MKSNFPISFGVSRTDPEFHDPTHVLKLFKKTIKAVLSGFAKFKFSHFY